MRTCLVLFVVLLLAWPASAQVAPKKYYLGDRVVGDAVICDSADAPIQIADIFAKKGIDAAMEMYNGFRKASVCTFGRAARITLVARIHHAEGDFGMMNVYRAVLMQGTEFEKTVYIPSPLDVVEENNSGCDLSAYQRCA